MKVILELKDQESNIKKITVRHDIIIGRGADCNLRLSAPQVSRRHCFLRISAEGAFVSDLDSSNGTYLNGTRIASGKKYPLKDNAQLSVGPVKFVAHVKSEVVEALQVSVSDEGLETEAAFDSDGEFGATVADPVEEMDFSVEHAGAAAGDDEPTADYVGSDDATYFSDVDDPAEVIPDDEILIYTDSDSESPATVPDAEEVVHVVDEADLVEIHEEDMLLIDEDDLVIEDEDEETLTNEDISGKTPRATKPVEADNDEEELRDFLQGLD